MTTIVTPPSWTEFEEPTPEQFAGWLEAMTHAERVEIARRLLLDRACSDRCFIENHVAQIAELAARRQASVACQMAGERCRQVAGIPPPDTVHRKPAAGVR